MRRFSKIMQINCTTKGHYTSGFFIRFQNVIITRSSVVGEVILWEQRVINYCVTKTSHNKRNETEEWFHIVSWNSEASQTVQRNWLFQISATKRKILTGKVQISAVETTINDLAAESSKESSSAHKARRILDVTHSLISTNLLLNSAFLFLQISVIAKVTTDRYGYERIICRVDFGKNWKRSSVLIQRFQDKDTPHFTVMSTLGILAYRQRLILVNIRRSPF